MPRLVRQAPLSVRIKAYLDPWDWLLWIAEELNDDSYDDWLKAWATPIGLALNLLFILSRGSGKAGFVGSGSSEDEVFVDVAGQGTGRMGWLAAFLVHSLTVACCLNAVFTFFRKRHYRLFEQPVDVAPETPSARRVRVDSSPVSSSPLRYLQSVISEATATARAYPDAEREVWEVSVWDPKPFNLTLFTLFSPGHLLLYYSLLPTAPMDSRPSVTVFMAIAFGALLSFQLSLLKTSFSQQAKDSSLIHGEVMNEYDTKFVRPSLNRPVRDVGIQTRESSTTPKGAVTREVDVYTPTTIINRGFRTNPNPNYAAHYDPNNLAAEPDIPRRQSGGLPRSATTPNLITPKHAYSQTNGFSSAALSSRPSTSGIADFSSPLKPHHERVRERSPRKGDGGSFGIYSHAASPLRKFASSNSLNPRLENDGRHASPLKPVGLPGTTHRAGTDNLDAVGRRRREPSRY